MSDPHSSAFEQRARILIQQHRWAEASDYLRQSLAADPENAPAIYLLAVCQSNMNEDSKTVIETVHRGLAADSEFVPLYIHKSAVLIDNRKWKEALESIDTALSIDPQNSDAFLMQAQAYRGLDRFADAEESVRKSLELDPDNQHAGNFLAEILRLRSKNSETEIQVESLLAKDPNDAYTHATAGWAALEKSDLEKAKYHFLESLRLKPDFEYARLGVVETYKAQSPLYRIYLQYSFKMQKLGSANQIAVIIGLLIISKAANKLFPGPIGTAITVLYLIFVLWSWFANGVGNLFLLTNSFARRALLTSEKLEAVFVGGFVTAGAAAALISFAGSIPLLFGISMILIGSAFPFACTFSNSHSLGKKLYGTIGTVVLGAGVIGVLLPQSGLISVVYLLCIVVMWMGSFGVLRRA